MSTMKIALVGDFASWSTALELSYKRAFEALSCQVQCIDIQQFARSTVRFGRFGRVANQLVQVEPWLRKANRMLVLAILQARPDVVITFGDYRLSTGALAQIKAASSAALVHVWPDTLLNWRNEMTPALPLYDLIATYSKATVPLFQALGARRVQWIPLGCDPTLHAPSAEQIESPPAQDIEVSFVGGWRPEREAVLKQLGQFDLKVWGPDWGKRSTDRDFIRRTWQGRALYGSDFTQTVARSKINLNIIDPTNFPAANMRFFEIPVAGGLQVCSSCPEMEDILRHGEHLFYYQHPDALPDLLRSLLADDTLRAQVGSAGRQQVLAEHTYTHRARHIVEILDSMPR